MLFKAVFVPFAILFLFGGGLLWVNAPRRTAASIFCLMLGAGCLLLSFGRPLPVAIGIVLLTASVAVLRFAKRS